MARRKNVDYTNLVVSSSSSVTPDAGKEQVSTPVMVETASFESLSVDKSATVAPEKAVAIEETKAESAQKKSLSLVFEVLDALMRKSSNILFRQAVLDFKSLTSGKSVETSMSDNCAELKRFLTIFYRQSYDVQERLKLKKAISVIESMA